MNADMHSIAAQHEDREDGEITVFCTCGHECHPTEYSGHIFSLYADKLQQIKDLLPPCRTFSSDVVTCVGCIGGTFENGTKFIPEMACLPCKIRMVIEENDNE